MAAVTILAKEGVLPVVAMVEMVVGRPVMRVVVAESHGGESRKTGFLADFGPDFLLFQAMKATSIYRRWKRAILSTLRKTFSP